MVPPHGFALLAGPALVSNLAVYDTMVVFVATFNVLGRGLRVHIHTSTEDIEGGFAENGQTPTVAYISARLFSVVTAKCDALGCKKPFSDGTTSDRAIAEAYKVKFYFDGGKLDELAVPKLTVRGGVDGFTMTDSTYTASLRQWDPIFEDETTLRISVIVPDVSARTLKKVPVPIGYQVHCTGTILGVVKASDALDRLSIVIQDMLVFRLTEPPQPLDLWTEGFEAVINEDTDN